MTKVITFAGVNLLISGFSPVMDATLQDDSIRRRHTGYRPETANLINIYNMCGIVAIFNISGPMGQLRDKALRMSQKIRHRGPDFSQHEEHYGLSHIGEREIAEYEDYLRQKE